MPRGAGLALLLAISTVITGFTQQNTARKTSGFELGADDSQLVGSWRLVSRVVSSNDGRVIQDPGLGATPIGYLIYDRSGHMAVQIMKRNRASEVECTSTGPTPANNSRSVNGYDAYFGTYTVNQTRHTVTHQLEGALAESDVGKNLVRQFQVSGDKLTIAVTTDSPEGQQTRTLTWERVH